MTDIDELVGLLRDIGKPEKRFGEDTLYVRIPWDAWQDNLNALTTLQAKVAKLEEGHNEFNRAINHALDQCDSGECYEFLSYWREGDWDACREYDFQEQSHD